MKQLLILGAGTAGTMVANRMRRCLSSDWAVSVVDSDDMHLYQPGLLFLPFGARNEKKMLRQRRRTLAPGVQWIQRAVERVEPTRRRVVVNDKTELAYDLLVIATGAQLRPDETPGLLGEAWRHSIHDFYTLQGAQALRDALASFRGGRLVLNVVEMPIKCPVAPMEFLFLADEFFTQRKMRNSVELVYVTPLDGAFTRPTCNKVLSYLIEQKGIKVETEFSTGEVDSYAHTLLSYDGRKIDYDLLVTVPTHGGAPFVDASGLGNELGFVPTDPHTLAAKGDHHIFVLGDATDLPSSKAGSVAHFQSEVLERNLLRAIADRNPEPEFDGHANCFVETGRGKALLIDFNYEIEPLPGMFPLPRLGPLKLLKESRLNHFGKLGFRWLYWNMLLPGRHLPVPTRMCTWGKEQPETALAAIEGGGGHATA